MEFRAKLHRKGSNPYKIILDRCTLGPSCRFARRFGSKSFLRIKIPAPILHNPNNELNSFFSKPFVFWGRIFRAFYAKDDTVFLFLTNELMEDLQIVPGVFPGLSLFQFAEWHNPLSTNVGQVCEKCSSMYQHTTYNISDHDKMVCPLCIGTIQLSSWPEGGIPECATSRRHRCVFLSYFSFR